MSQSWRITLDLDNRSQKVLPSAGAGIGGTVIQAPRGKAEAVYFQAGESDRLLQNYGTPSATNKEMLEVLEYNKSYPIYVGAPYGSDALFGGIHFLDTGSVAFSQGVTSENIDHSLIPSSGSLGTGDDTTLIFNVTVSDYEKYNNDSLDILVGGVSVGVIDFVDTGPGQSFSVSDAGTYDGLAGTIDSTTNGALSVTLPAGTAPAAGVPLTYTLTQNWSADVVFSLVNGGPQTDDLGVIIAYDSTTELFNVDVARKDTNGVYTSISNTPKDVSLNPDSIDGYGISNYILEVFKDLDFFTPVVNTLYGTIGVIVDDAARVDFSGGSRGAGASASDVSLAYNDFRDHADEYLVDVFFDVTALPEVASKFVELRNGPFPFKRFVLPLPMESAADAITTFQGMSIANRGLSFYWNWFELRNDYATSGNLILPPIGEMAVKHADIIVRAFGGMAPAWIDENGMGGQLGSGRFVKAVYSADEATLKQLDDERINPIVFDKNYGVIAKSRRTSAAGLSDYSFIGYSGATDYILENIMNQVLPYQLVKFNDPSHRDRVRNQAISVIQPMTVTPKNVIYQFAVKCDGENNNDDVLNREEFVLEVAVKVTRKSRTVIFRFVNMPQNVEISEAFA